MSEDETDDDQSNFVFFFSKIVNKTANICQLMDVKTILSVVHLSFGDLNKFHEARHHQILAILADISG